MNEKKGTLAPKCTVMIDSTINLEQSQDFHDMFNNSEIKGLIDEGKLNIVFLRSAQKFDMLGIDNYYGGISTSINNHAAFGAFNERMNQKDDQLRGLSYQGLAHLQANCGQELEAYRSGIMKNTQLLYNKLPKEAIYQEGTTNPMQISQINDDKIVFLDIKFPNNKNAAKAFRKLINRLY